MKRQAAHRTLLLPLLLLLVALPRLGHAQCPAAFTFGPDRSVCHGSTTVLNVPQQPGTQYQYRWFRNGVLVNNNNTPSLTVFQAGTYVLHIVSTSANCSARDTININYFQAIGLSFTGGKRIRVCNGQQSVQVGQNVVAQSNNPPLQYWWDGVSTAWQTSPLANVQLPLPGGGNMLFLHVRDANGCENWDTLFIDVAPRVIANPGPDVFLCQPNTAPFTLSGSAQGGVAPYQYRWNFQPNFGPNASAVVNLSPGANSYVLFVRDANGCESSEPMMVFNGFNVDAGPAAVSSCAGGISNGIQLNATHNFGQNAQVTYTWQPPTGLNNANIPNPVASATSGTITYVVTATAQLPGGQTCSATDNIQVTFGGMQVNAGRDRYLCAPNSTILIGDSVQISGGVAPFEYRWNFQPNFTNSAAQNAPLQQPVNTFTLTVRDANGCVATDNVTIYNGFTASAGPDLSVCGGQASGVQLNATNSFNTASGSNPVQVTYVWQPPTGLSNANIPNPTYSGPVPRTLSVVATAHLPNGQTCSFTDQVVISGSQLTVNGGPDRSSCGGPVTLGPATAAGMPAGSQVTYTWSGPGITNPVNGASFTLPVAQSGVYIVTARAGTSSNCVATDTVLVLAGQGPQISFGGNQHIYVCQNVQTLVIGQNIVATGSVGPYQYQWSGLNATWATSPVATVQLPANPTNPVQLFFLYVRDANGCVSHDTLFVHFRPRIQANAGPDVTFCGAGVQNFNLVGSATGGLAPYQYRWNFQTAFSTSGAAVVNPGPGRNVYVLTVRDANGCEQTDEVIINNGFRVNAGPDRSVCGGQAHLQLNAMITPAPAAGSQISFVWSPAAGLSNPNIPNPVYTGPGGITYIVTATAANNLGAPPCTSTDTIHIAAGSLVAQNSQRHIIRCGPAGNVPVVLGQGVTVTASSGPVSYQWFGPQGAISNPSSSPTFTVLPTLPVSVYKLEVKDTAGCRWADSTLVIFSRGSMHAGPDKTIGCNATTGVQLQGFGPQAPGISYSWSPAAGLSNPNILNPIASPTVTTDYVLTATFQANGQTCTERDTMRVVVGGSGTGSNFSASIQHGSNFVCRGDSVRMSAVTTGAFVSPLRYEWSVIGGLPFSNQPVVVQFPMQRVTYRLSITDGCGNTRIDTFTVHVSADCVWPGDANHDNVVNMRDVLAMGVASGFQGPVRPNASLQWRGQHAPNWNRILSNGTNFKHCDATGNGVVDSFDIRVVRLNHGRFHPKTGPVRGTASGNNPPIYLSTPQLPVGPSTPVSIAINLGNSAHPANDFYGVSFSIAYQTELVMPGSANVRFFPSWFGTQGVDMFGLALVDEAAGRIHVGLTGTNQQNRNGMGQIATLDLVTIDNLSGKAAGIEKTLYLTFEDVYAQGIDEVEIPLDALHDSLIISDSPASIHQAATAVDLNGFPNPTADGYQLVWSAPGAFARLQVIDATGRLVMQQTLDAASTSFRIETRSFLSAGVYTLVLDGGAAPAASLKLVVAQ